MSATGHETDLTLEKAQSAYLSNDLSRCETICRQVAHENPHCVPALLLIGFCCARTRRREEAIRCFESVLATDSESLEAHIALSTLYISNNHVREAVLHGLKAIELDPVDPTFGLGLTKALGDKGKFEESIPVWKLLVNLFPNDPSYLRRLATAQGLAKLRADCIASWEEVVRLAPGRIADLLELGRALLADSKADRALEVSEQILRIDRNHVDAHLLAAMALSEDGNAIGAEIHLNRVLKHSPKNVIAIASLGLCLQEQGRFEEARKPLRDSIALWPVNGLAYYALLRSQKVTEKDLPILTSIEEQLTTPQIDPLHRAYMHYALGKGLEDLGQYEDSFRNYEAANRVAYNYWLAHRPWDKERYAFNFNRTIEVFSRQGISDVQRQGLVSDRPLFVIGMIRSGTTLVEQILSSHPDICAAGEQTFWHEQAGRIFHPTERAVDKQALVVVADEYLALLNRFSATSARVTDKLPHNYALVGIIKAAIPGAKFIHIRRNPLDNCLSIFTTAYQRPPAFTLDKDNIVFAYQQYDRIMQHWGVNLDPDDLLEVSYEDLVQNRELVTRRMIDFAGLDWSDSCLSHEKNERSVHTPSTWQVRQPIYSSSVERWRRFEPWLAEFQTLNH